MLARISIVRPILASLLTGIKKDVLDDLGGINNIKLKLLPRAYLPGCGDIGFCFEWAVHDAVRRKYPQVLDRLVDASKKCKLAGTNFESILFGLEKAVKYR